MGGTRNGARLTSFVKRSGGAKSEFLGYELKFKSRERWMAEHLSSLEIPDIEGAEALLLEDLFEILQEDNTEILME